MQLDEAKIKEKLDRINNPEKYRGDGTSAFWKPKQGEPNTLRLFSYPGQEPEDPYIECWFHYGVGNGSPILCLKKMAQKDCPICQWCYTKLLKSKEPEDRKLYQKIRATQRFFASMIDRSDSTLKPKLWSFGKTVYKTLLEDLLNPDYRNYLDPNKGFDLTVTMEKKKDMMFPVTNLRWKPKEVPLAKDSKEVERIMTQTPKIRDVFKLLSVEEVKQRLQDAWISNDDVSQKVAEEQKYSEPVDDDLDVDAEFEKALGKDQ